MIFIGICDVKVVICRPPRWPPNGKMLEPPLRKSRNRTDGGGEECVIMRMIITRRDETYVVSGYS